MPRATLWLLFGLLGTASAETPLVQPSPWDIRMRRVEGAAAGVRRAAEDVGSTSKTISNSSNLADLALLKTQLIELNRLVVSARLAVVVSGEESARP
jgi:hypothetical protein